jgi:hypothetical protein
MSLYEPKQLADSVRVIGKNTIQIAEDIPGARHHHHRTRDCAPVTMASFLIGARRRRLRDELRCKKSKLLRFNPGRRAF